MDPGNSKTYVQILGTGTGLTNGATATARFDTFGAEYAQITVVLGTSNTVSNKPSTLKLSMADVTNSTAFLDISGAVGGPDFTIPNADTSNPNIYAFGIDLRGRQRYLLTTLTPRTTQEAFVMCELFRQRLPSEISVSGVGQAQLVANV